MPPKPVVRYNRDYDEDLEDVDMDRESDGEAEDTFDDTEMHQEPHPNPPANPNVLLPAPGQTGYFPNPVFTDKLGVKVSPTDNYPFYDDGPKRPNENKNESEQRIDRASIAMGLERKPVFQSIAQGPAETDAEYHSRYSVRYVQKKNAEALHRKKMDPNDREYDQVYANYYIADKAARRQRNAQRRAAALAHRRAHDLANSRPRAATPDPAEDSGDERYAPRQFAQVPTKQKSKFRQQPPPHFPPLGYTPASGHFPVGIKTNPPSDRCELCEKDKTYCDLGKRGWYPCTRCVELRKEGQCVNGKGRAGRRKQRPDDEPQNGDDEDDDDDDDDEDDDNDDIRDGSWLLNPQKKSVNIPVTNNTVTVFIQQLGYTPNPGQWPEDVRTNPPSTRCNGCTTGKKGTCDLWDVGYPCTQCVHKGIGHLCRNGKGYVLGPKASIGQGPNATQPFTLQRQDQHGQTSAFNDAAQGMSSLPVPTQTGPGAPSTSIPGFIPSGPSGPGQPGSAPLTGTPALVPKDPKRKRPPPTTRPKDPRSNKRPKRQPRRSASPPVRDEGCTNCDKEKIYCVGDSAPCEHCSRKGLSCDLDTWNGTIARPYRNPQGSAMGDDEEDGFEAMMRRRHRRQQTSAQVDQEPWGNRTNRPNPPGESQPGTIDDDAPSGFNMNDMAGQQDMPSYYRQGPVTNAPPSITSPFEHMPNAEDAALDRVHGNVLLPSEEPQSYPAGNYAPWPVDRYGFPAQPGDDNLAAHRAAMEALTCPPPGLEGNNEIFDGRTNNEIDYWEERDRRNREIDRRISENIALHNGQPYPGTFDWITGEPSLPLQIRRRAPSNGNQIARPVFIPNTNIPITSRALFNWDGTERSAGPTPDFFQGKVVFKQEWDVDDLAGFVPGQFCHEIQGICAGTYPNYILGGELCMKDFAKRCDWLDHNYGHNNHIQICDDCHKQQHDFFAAEHTRVERDLKAWTCGDCANTLRSSGTSTLMSGKANRCECLATLMNRWFCLNHAAQLTESFKSAINNMGAYFARSFPDEFKENKEPCVSCGEKEVDPSKGVWACKVCRMWKHHPQYSY